MEDETKTAGCNNKASPENAMAEAVGQEEKEAVLANDMHASNVKKEQASPEDNKSAVTLSEPLVAKRRRPGRPKKYCDDDVVSSPLRSSQMNSAESSAAKKRGRGRPKGSGRKPVFMDSVGCFGLNVTGSFTPHVFGVAAGEDVVRKIMSVAHSGPRSVCILSAQGRISTAVIRQPSGVFFKYEGRFQIISLAGTFVVTAMAAGVQRKIGKLSVSLCRHDGRIFGGATVASLVACDDVHVVLGSFKQDASGRLPSSAGNVETEDTMFGPDDLVGVPIMMAPNDDAEERPFTPSTGFAGPSNIIYDAVPISYYIPPPPPFFAGHQDVFGTIPEQPQSFAADNIIFQNI